MILFKKNIASFLVLYSGVMFITPSFATKNDAKSLEKINKQIEEKKKEAKVLEAQSKKLQTEISQTQNKMVEIANNVKKYERQLNDYDKQLANLQSKEKTLNKKIENNNQELIKIIAIFENISSTPKGYLIVSPSKVDTIFQSSLLLKSVVENLNQSRKEFAHDLDELVKLKDDIVKAKLSIYSLNNKVKGEKDKIAGLIKSKQSSYKKLTSQNLQKQAEIKKLVSESKTIEEFLKKAENLRKKNTAKSSVTKKIVAKSSLGKVALPINGTIATYFGDKKIGGVKSKGIYMKARSGSQVISPTDAEVVFAGAFYGYNNLLILHTSDNHYIIMGGMNEVFATEGQSLLAGEPVGQMGNGEFYIELRDNTTPINPLNYFNV
ncbi:peptidoglycan DD-metalloendopeptidase family protein [bacterium]|nr:peptidoglycan DD-metalloendopeptidase family protein [bacterium]